MTKTKIKNILLRDVPDEVIAAINKKKIEILTSNPHRTKVSDSEAAFKIMVPKIPAKP